MHFTLKRPCADCPFRTDCTKGWLGRSRARQISLAITAQQQTFACHKTTKHDEEGEVYSDSDAQHCAGALILLEKLNQPNQLMRIAERLRAYDRTKLDMASPVFDTTAAFVKHHA